jgi:ketosteroid isomerase-like protein
MKKIVIFMISALMSVVVMADHHLSAEAELRTTVIAFNEAYAANDLERYFSYFAKDADMYWSGSRQTVAGYYEDYSATVEAGGAVQKNGVVDLKIRMLPGDEAGIVTFFVDYRFHNPGGAITVEKAFETEVWQKIDGAWKLVGLHNNVIPPE